MSDDGALFYIASSAAPQIDPKASQTVRRTRRQAALLAVGIHPLSAVASRLRLHPEAAPYGDPRAPGRRCGNCRFREVLSYRGGRYPKCVIDGGTRITSSAASDVRAWWGACTHHEWKEERDG